MRLLETHGCQGGAHAGYVRAGWDVTGVDIDKRHARYYPGKLIIGDAATVIRDFGHAFDAIHASPPCQWYTRGNAKGRAEGNSKWERTIPAIREAMLTTGRPYVIENVTDAGWDMLNPVALCGCMCRVSEQALFELPAADIPPAFIKQDERCGHITAAANPFGQCDAAFVDLGSRLHWWAYTSVQLDRTGARLLAESLMAWVERGDA